MLWSLLLFRIFQTGVFHISAGSRSFSIELIDESGDIQTNQGENNAIIDEKFLDLEDDIPFATGLQTSGAIEVVSDGVNEHNIDDTNKVRNIIEHLYGDSLDLSIDQLNKEDFVGLSSTDVERIYKELEDENDEWNDRTSNSPNEEILGSLTLENEEEHRPHVDFGEKVIDKTDLPFDSNTAIKILRSVKV